ncbi:MAG: hypothetical protein ACRDQX_06745 [Pseudonocardiaceae bacterium]
MADTLIHAYAADIVKAERDAAGDLLVYGKATGSDRDLDGQRCDSAWLEKAMPAWHEWGNCREMHQPIAAGVGVELTNDGDDWFVKSKVVDPNTARKIEAGVLKGYSIGIKSPVISKRDGQEWITGGSIVELSYVDRPCLESAKMTMLCKMVGADLTPQPVEAVTETPPTPRDLAGMLRKTADALTTEEPTDLAPEAAPAGEIEPSEPPAAPEPMRAAPPEDEPPETTAEVKGSVLDSEDLVKRIVAELAKRQFTQAERDASADEGQALPDGSFPIKTVADVKNAVHAIGRAKNPAKAKKHIRTRAMALKRPDLIPEAWKATTPDLTKADDGMTHDPADIQAVRDGLVALIKAELDELCDGDPELSDVAELLCSLRMLMCWWEGEAAGGETTTPYTKPGQEPAMSLAATPDTTKTADPAPAATQAAELATKTPGPAGSGDENRLAELVKSAIADAAKVSEERITALETQLEKVLALPEPGGPVITRTATQAATARHTDELQLQAQVDTLLRKAATASDPYLRKGYTDRAKELAAKAA